MMSVKINKLIQDRYSPRAFSSQKVEASVLESLLEAARWAASAFNAQPARYIIGQKGDEHYEKIFTSLMPKNQEWNKPVPVLILTLVKIRNAYNGKLNAYAQHDLGLATGNLVLQAMDQGLYVHPMAGFDKLKVRELFQIPEDYQPMTVLAVGYLGNSEELPEDFRKIEEAPRERRTLDQIIFQGDWEKMS